MLKQEELNAPEDETSEQKRISEELKKLAEATTEESTQQEREILTQPEAEQGLENDEVSSATEFSKKEKSFLEKVKGEARGIASAFLLVSALSGCGRSENEPQAPPKPDNKSAATATIEQPRPQPIIERQKKVEEKEIEDDGNITESSKWSNEISQNWSHVAGRVCFERTIDKQLYPPLNTMTK